MPKLYRVFEQRTRPQSSRGKSSSHQSNTRITFSSGTIDIHPIILSLNLLLTVLCNNRKQAEMKHQHVQKFQRELQIETQ